MGIRDKIKEKMSEIFLNVNFPKELIPFVNSVFYPLMPPLFRVFDKSNYHYSSEEYLNDKYWL